MVRSALIGFLLALGCSTAWAQDAGSDAGNPFEADMGQCESDADCPEGYACGLGQCEFFDAVGDMGLGGVPGGDAGGEAGGDSGSTDTPSTKDDGGCATASGAPETGALLLLGLLALKRRRG